VGPELLDWAESVGRLRRLDAVGKRIIGVGSFFAEKRTDTNNQ
jgi:hypothetical protein